LRTGEDKELGCNFQTKFSAEAVGAAAAGNLNSKKELAGVSEVGSVAVELCVVTAAPVAEPKNVFWKVLQVLPSQRQRRIWGMMTCFSVC
jgi:hypothetical protein